MDIRLNILKRNEELTKEIEMLNAALANAPEGRMVCYDERGFLRFYLRENGKKIYLNRSESENIRKFIIKDYCRQRLKECEAEIAAGNAYLKLNKPHKTEQRLLLEQYREVLRQEKGLFILPPTDKELTDWMKAPYDKNPNYQENLIYRAVNGIYMRSKSETEIALMLTRYNVPYRYECKLLLENGFCYPDFTIMHPKTGKIILWEHYGMIDDSNYRRKMFNKNDVYMANGYYPSVNLITTWETRDHPLDMAYVDMLINHHFL